MPLQQQHLSSLHHPSRVQPEGRERAAFVLASTSVLFAPYVLKTAPASAPKPFALFVALVTLKELPARRGCNYGYG